MTKLHLALCSSLMFLPLGCGSESDGDGAGGASSGTGGSGATSSGGTGGSLTTGGNTGIGGNAGAGGTAGAGAQAGSAGAGAVGGAGGTAGAGAGGSGGAGTGGKPATGGTGGFTGPGWTVTNDFENGVVGQVTTNGREQTLYSKDQASSGTQSGKMTIYNGEEGKHWGGGLNFGNLGSSEIKQGDEIWFRIRWYFPTSFSFDSSPGFKMMRLGLSTGGFFSIIGKWNGSLNMDGETIGEDWYTGNYPQRDQLGPLKKGAWQSLEMYMKLHSVNGQAVTRVWNDGKLVFEDKKIRNIPAANSIINRSLIGTYWNGGAPKTQSNYIDDLVWTTQTPSKKDAAGNPFVGP